ncbi:MAG: Transcriptional regulator, partial [uncultured Thermoleophilia bacterium]
TASGSDGRAAASTRAGSCAAPMRRLRRWAPTDSPNAPGASCWRPARRCAGAATTPATSSRRRSCRSRGSPGTGGPTPRSAPSCSSAPARSNGTCARCSPSSGSPRAWDCAERWRAATSARRRP